MKLVELPDGTVVRAARLLERRETDDWRDFGLYLDDGWRPTWPADEIEWPDYGLPPDPERAAAQIRAAFDRARNGGHVEIGCRAALGRTGTVLACMAILAGVAPDKAVAWVREHYHPMAIETAEQKRFVLWFGQARG